MLKLRRIDRFSVKVRGARLEDIDIVYDIAVRSLSERYSKELFYDIFFLWPKGFLVAEINGRIVGFIAGSRLSELEGRILLFAVDRPFRRMGVGGKLMEEFLNICRLSSLRQVRLEVREDNYEAIEFYRKRGFQIVSVIRGYYSDGTNAYVMLRVIENIS